MRRATVVLLLLAMVAACNDLRDFRGSWTGTRVGDAAPLRMGLDGVTTAALAIDDISVHGLAGRLAIAGLLPETSIASVEGAEADALSGLTFSGGPLRAYLAFADVPDGGGAALVVVALYDDHRVEVRLLRGGPRPLYGIFALTEASEPT